MPTGLFIDMGELVQWATECKNSLSNNAWLDLSIAFQSFKWKKYLLSLKRSLFLAHPFKYCLAVQFPYSPIHLSSLHVRYHVSPVWLHLTTTSSPLLLAKAWMGGKTSGHPTARIKCSHVEIQHSYPWISACESKVHPYMWDFRNLDRVSDWKCCGKSPIPLQCNLIYSISSYTKACLHPGLEIMSPIPLFIIEERYSIYSDHIRRWLPLPKVTESSVFNSSVGGLGINMMKLEAIQLLHIWVLHLNTIKK